MHTEQQILIAGCGDLGIATAENLTSKYQVLGLRRDISALPSTIQGIQGDVTQLDSLTQLNALSPNIVIYCASAGAQNDESYHAVYVQGLRNILQSINQQQLKHVFFVSSTRVYNGNTEEWIDESVPAKPNDFGGLRLLEAEQILSTLNCGHTVLRLSGIYGPGRTRMIKLAQTPAIWPPTNSWTNRIHRDDAAAFIAYLIAQLAQHKPIATMYIVTDGVPTPQYEVLLWLAEHLVIAHDAIEVPKVAGGKKLNNKKLIESQFLLAYATFKAGYLSLIE